MKARFKQEALKRLRIAKAVPGIVEAFNSVFARHSFDLWTPALCMKINARLAEVRLLTENERFANFGCYVDSIMVAMDGNLLTLSVRFGMGAPQWVRDIVRKINP